MNRRGFFTMVGAMAAAPVLAAQSSIPPAIARSDKGVPLYLDGRVEPRMNICQPIQVRRYGVQVVCVAYDLRADFLVVYRKDPNGEPMLVDGIWEYETLHGGVSVHWDREELAKRAAHHAKVMPC